MDGEILRGQSIEPGRLPGVLHSVACCWLDMGQSSLIALELGGSLCVVVGLGLSISMSSNRAYVGILVS